MHRSPETPYTKESFDHLFQALLGAELTEHDDDSSTEIDLANDYNSPEPVEESVTEAGQ